MRADSLRRWLPGLEVARHYQRAWLRHDLVAGVVLTALLIPAGIGYAQAAGLPPQTGLYATIVPLLAYALVGPSRVLVLGPDSSLAPIIAVSVLPLAAGDPDRAVALAGLLAVLVGLVLLVGGLARIGAVTALLSRPIRIGYLNGIALVVIVSQLPAVLGVRIEATRSLGDVGAVVRELAGGRVNGTALAVGLVSLAVVVGLRVTVSPVAGVLGSVVGAVVVVAVAGLADAVPVVGAMPHGLPAPALGGLGWDDVLALAGPALGIALVAFADTAVLSRSLAARRGETVDGSHEMAAIGAANVAGGLLGGFPVSASSSRTPVAEQAGARTQLVGLLGAALLVAFVLLAPGLTGLLPSATLGAVVILAAASLVDVPGTVRLLRMNPVEGLLSVAALLGVALVGVLEGIVVAIALSLAAFVRHAWQPYRAELGLLPGVRGYHDLARHPEGSRLPGVVIVRFDAPLFFANGAQFDDYVRSVVDAAGPGVHTVILAAEPITDIDTTAAEELAELDDVLAARGVTLVFAEMKGPVKDRLHRYDREDGTRRPRYGPERFAPTVGAAVDRVTGRLRGDLGPDAAAEG